MVSMMFLLGLYFGLLGVVHGLNPGDVMIVGFNGDDPEEVILLVTTAISAGTEIFVTDRGYKVGDGTFRDGEGTIKYVVPSGGLAKGTVLDLTPASLRPNWSVVDSNFGLSSSGDSIIVYESDGVTTNFLYAAGFEITWSDATDSNESGLPPTLTNHNVLFSTSGENARYKGTRTGTLAELTTSIGTADNTNWDHEANAFTDFNYLKGIWTIDGIQGPPFDGDTGGTQTPSVSPIIQPTSSPVTATPTSSPITPTPTTSPITPTPTSSPTDSPTNPPSLQPTSSPTSEEREIYYRKEESDSLIPGIVAGVSVFAIFLATLGIFFVKWKRASVDRLVAEAVPVAVSDVEKSDYDKSAVESSHGSYV